MLLLLLFIRVLFLITATSFLLIGLNNTARNPQDIQVFVVGLVVTILAILVEWLTPKKTLSALAGIFFGLLVGMLISWAMSRVLEMLNLLFFKLEADTLQMVTWLMGVCICYLTISLVIRTKDDVRFVIPYIEFSRQTKGLRPLVLDTSVIIDGRIADIAETKLFDAPLIVPRFVLNELQLIADSPEKIKRNRGRRGLDMLNKLQNSTIVEVKIDDTPPPGIEDNAGVDQKLIAFTKNCDGRLVTNDFNLNKVATLRGVDVININDLANALKTVTLPGETMRVKIIRLGEEPTQGVGYLDDGTMVVVEGANSKIGQTISFTVTSSLQTSAGRMIFGKFENGAVSANT
ncbi:MAG TPA: TRAM domain-containing protein [Anaerohalosphaeraceae bacterium]|nr:TRAM domain-containing protein [Anaerohalosphaeraceae bacterium]